MAGAANYAGWEAVEMDAGPGDLGFYFNNTDESGMKGLKWNSGYTSGEAPNQYNEFGGWLGESILHSSSLARSYGF